MEQTEELRNLDLHILKTKVETIYYTFDKPEEKLILKITKSFTNPDH